jgi:hypothetical protein
VLVQSRSLATPGKKGGNVVYKRFHKHTVEVGG